MFAWRLLSSFTIFFALHKSFGNVADKILLDFQFQFWLGSSKVELWNKQEQQMGYGGCREKTCYAFDRQNKRFSSSFLLKRKPKYFIPLRFIIYYIDILYILLKGTQKYNSACLSHVYQTDCGTLFSKSANKYQYRDAYVCYQR